MLTKSRASADAETPHAGRRNLLRAGLAAAVLASASSLALAADAPGGPEIAWELRVVRASWAGRPPANPAPWLIDLGGDPVGRDQSVRTGTLLAERTGLRLGATFDLGTVHLSFPLGEALTVESGPEAADPVDPAEAGTSFRVDIEPRSEPTSRGGYVARVDLEVSRRGGGGSWSRELQLRPHRTRLWVLPVEDGVVGLVIGARPAADPPRLRGAGEDLDIELALVRADWTAAPRPGELPQSDFETWLDPFRIEAGSALPISLAGFLRPIAPVSATGGELLFRQRLIVPPGAPARVEEGEPPRHAERMGDPESHGPASGLSAGRPARGRAGRGARRAAPGGAHRSAAPFTGIGVSALDDAANPGLLRTTINLQSSHLGSEDLVVFRKLGLQEGQTQAWLIPTDAQLLALFVRVTRRRPSHPVPPSLPGLR